MNHLPWDIGRSTDRNMRLLFKNLQDKYEDLEFYYPRNILSAILPVVGHFFKAVKGRILKRLRILKKLGFSIKREKLISEKEFTKQHFDVIYTQGVIPHYGKSNIPFLCDLSFIDPENTDAVVTNESILRWKELIEDMGKVAKEKCIINLRSNYSLRLVHEYYPEYEYKFVNIPFLLPDLKAVSCDYALQKHTNISNFKIAFVGAQAKRKGIDLLVKSIEILYKRGVRNFELHIVSGFTDGKINISDELPIICHGTRDYSYTMNILKNAHLYVMPSYFESFGLSYVEAMANGCIVLARNFEPQREIVNYGKAGFVINLNPEDIADKIQHVLEMEEAQRKEFVLNGLEYFKGKYDYSVVSEQWHEEFKRCVSLYR